MLPTRDNDKNQDEPVQLGDLVKYRKDSFIFDIKIRLKEYIHRQKQGKQQILSV